MAASVGSAKTPKKGAAGEARQRQSATPGGRPEKTSWASSEAVRASMRSNRPRDTAPEVRLRSALHRAGLRFYKHRRPIPGLRCEPDVVFSRVKLAIFLDGCYWHGCTEHRTIPVTNGEWWEAKIRRNRERDTANDERLAAEGWTVLRFWEHESLHEVTDVVTHRVAELRALGLSRPETSPSSSWLVDLQCGGSGVAPVELFLMGKNRYGPTNVEDPIALDFDRSYGSFRARGGGPAAAPASTNGSGPGAAAHPNPPPAPPSLYEEF